MKTIYDHLLDKRDKKEDRLSDREFEALINLRLIDLLYKATGINLSTGGLSFSAYMTTIGEHISVIYKCLYGKASISMKKNILSVTFTFSYDNLKHHKIPLTAEKCFIKVDHELNFKQATFNHYVHFSMLTIDKTNDGSIYGSVNISRIVYPESNSTNTVSYLNGTIGGCYVDMMPFGLNDLFFKADNEFDDLVVRTMIFCQKNPHSFYELFPEYPSYIDFMKDIERATEFFNLLHKQYMLDSDILFSRLLLLDMQSI